MNRTRLIPRLCFGLTVALTLVAMLTRTVAFFTHFDADVGYFDHTWGPRLYTILAFLAVICPIVCGFLCPKEGLSTSLEQGHRHFVAFLLLLAFLLFPFLLLAEKGLQSGKWMNVAMILSLGSTVYACLVLFQVKAKQWVALAGFLPIFWSIILIAQTYTDPYITMNSPVKLSMQFGAIGLMLGLCAELRFHLAKPTPRVYMVGHCVAIFFCLNASLPYLIVRAAGQLEYPLYHLWAIVLLCAGLYFLARLFLWVFLPPAPDVPASALASDAPASDAPEISSAATTATADTGSESNTNL